MKLHVLCTVLWILACTGCGSSDNPAEQKSKVADAAAAVQEKTEKINTPDVVKEDKFDEPHTPSLTGDFLTNIFLFHNPKIIEKQDFMEYLICKMDGKNFGAMKSNEFEFKEYFARRSSEIQEAIRTSVSKLVQTAEKYGEKEQYLLKDVISGTIGEYNFENEEFDFRWPDFRFLKKNFLYTGDCRRSSFSLARPNYLPIEFHLYVANKNAVGPFSFSPEGAKALLNSRTRGSRIDRSVQMESMLRIDPAQLVIDPEASIGRALRADIYIDELQLTNYDGSIIAEYPTSNFREAH